MKLTKIAASIATWREYFDADMAMEESEFETLSQVDRVKLLIDAFGVPDYCDINAQRDGAANHGDDAQVALCDLALAGDNAAAAQCLIAWDESDN